MRGLGLYTSNSSLTRLTARHTTDDTLGLCKVTESEDLTEQSTFDLVAGPEQNEFEVRMVHALQSSAGTLQMLLRHIASDITLVHGDLVYQTRASDSSVQIIYFASADSDDVEQLMVEAYRLVRAKQLYGKLI